MTQVLVADKLDSKTVDTILAAQIDVKGALDVNIQLDRATGKVWVNLNGICILRIYDAQHIKLRHT